MTPKERYQQDLHYNAVQVDPYQAQVVDYLQQCYHALLTQQKQQQKIRHKLSIALKIKKQPAIQGLYLWGNVGVGKTYLMDLFYHSLTFSEKKRLHFHSFMQEIHDQLRQYRHLSNPLPKLAKDWAKQVKVLCLDEFMVMDITDAMILARLLEAFFQQGIMLVTTSNVAPSQLYANGLQRELFLPTITLLEKNTKVIHLASDIDYRCHHLSRKGIYFHPLNATTAIQMRQLFAQLTNETVTAQLYLTILDRRVPVRYCGSDIVWFDFDVLCHTPRSQNDYLSIAKRFHTVFLSGVPAIKEHQDDIITYFIHLVDIFYDAKVKLVINAEVPIEALYRKGRLSQAFKRTQSRLIEMQSEQYLHQSHITLSLAS